MKLRWLCLGAACVCTLAACNAPEESVPAAPVPSEIIDLGVLVTEDLPAKTWGKAMLEQNGFDRNNAFEILINDHPGGAQTSNSYYTLFNHGGPHVDAPSHLALGGGVDSFSVESFAGPLKVIDVSAHDPGWSVPLTAFEDAVLEEGDVVLIHTGASPPASDEDLPVVISITPEAARYLASIPIRAFGTDAVSVHAVAHAETIDAADPTMQLAPIHHIFLSKGIPIYEQLENVDRLLGRRRMYFVGQPLNIADGDGMMVRPFVLVF